MDEHGKLVKKALEAIKKVFEDTSVSQEETGRSLQSLIDEMMIFMSTLDC